MTQVTVASTIFQPVAAPSTFEETVGRLGTAIRIGVLQPGERLPPERVLAVRLGISRSTLRQALAQLTETGHLVAQRGRTGGTFVAADPPVASGATFRPEASRELMDWRMTLELGAVQLAAERATHLQRQAIATASAVDRFDDWAGFRREDARFHLLLAQAARSPLVVDAMTRVQGELSDLFTHLELNNLQWGSAQEQHRAVADAVVDGDAARARDAMRAHLATTERYLDGALNE